MRTVQQCIYIYFVGVSNFILTSWVASRHCPEIIDFKNLVLYITLYWKVFQILLDNRIFLYEIHYIRYRSIVSKITCVKIFQNHNIIPIG